MHAYIKVKSQQQTNEDRDVKYKISEHVRGDTLTKLSKTVSE